MLVIGLTGGIATGKSLVSKIWQKEGAYIIDADEIAKDLVKPHLPSWKKIVDEFGVEILKKDETIDRKRLASIVFSNPDKREILNKIIHPRIKEEIYKRLKEIGEKDSKAIVVIDAPLLIELGEYHGMDKVVVVASSIDKQIERIKIRNGLEEQEARKIIDSQMPISEKIKFADFIIINDGSLEEVEMKAIQVFNEIKKIAHQKIYKDILI